MNVPPDLLCAEDQDRATPARDSAVETCAVLPSQRALLVDAHQMFRQSLRFLLESQMGLTVAEAQTGTEALAQIGREVFDFVLMDVHLADANGIGLACRILEKHRETRIIVLSADSDPLRIDEALRAGVMGYVLKTNAAEELRRAITSVGGGTRYLSPEANAALLAGYQRLRETPVTTTPLSPREHEVVRLIAAGQRTREIAEKLGIGLKSAETYRHRLKHKLGLFSVAEITRYAIREGLTAI